MFNPGLRRGHFQAGGLLPSNRVRICFLSFRTTRQGANRGLPSVHGTQTQLSHHRWLIIILSNANYCNPTFARPCIAGV